MKTCSRCGVAKPFDEFHRFVHSRDGHTPECRSCIQIRNREYRHRNRDKLRLTKQRQYRADPAAALAKGRAWKEANLSRHQFLQRRSHLKRMYNITPEQYDEMLHAQDGTCALCRQPSGNRLHVDHDHCCCPGKKSCGDCIRGLLCGPCNRLLGWYDARRDAIHDYTAKEKAWLS